MDIASEHCGAACGHGAFAAALGFGSVIEVLIYFPTAEGGESVQSWVNMPSMDAALLKAGRKFRIIGREWPKFGLVMIQFTGPWTRPGVPPRVACMYRHWIAVDGGEVWDANLDAWVTKAEWEQFLLMPKKGDGWTVARGYEL